MLFFSFSIELLPVRIVTCLNINHDGMYVYLIVGPGLFVKLLFISKTKQWEL